MCAAYKHEIQKKKVSHVVHANSVASTAEAKATLHLKNLKPHFK